MRGQQLKYLCQFLAGVNVRQVGKHHAAQFGGGFRLAACLPQRHAQGEVVGLGFPRRGQVARGELEVVLRLQAAADQGVDVSPVG
ncbi:hypothetical protein D3C73_1495240 [compost metagenome]